MSILLTNRSYMDYGVPWQYGFQFPATDIAHGLIELHNHICFFLVLIGVFTLYMLYTILKESTMNTGNDFVAFNQIKDLYNIKIRHNNVLEIVWIIVPTVILLIIALPSFSLLYAMEVTRESFMTMKVIGYQWYWSYEITFNTYEYSELNLPLWFEVIFRYQKADVYGDGIYNPQLVFDSYMVPDSEISNTSLRLLETTNPVVLPFKTNIKVLITANDVLHSWAVPALGIKVDACPGRLNQIMLNINRVGHFYGQCSELCGANHGFMPIEIYSVTMRAYFFHLCCSTDSMCWFQLLLPVMIVPYDSEMSRLVAEAKASGKY